MEVAPVVAPPKAKLVEAVLFARYSTQTGHWKHVLKVGWAGGIPVASNTLSTSERLSPKT